MFLPSFVRYHLKRKPVHLILHVTSRCNLACKHCFVDTTPKEGELGLEIYRRVAMEIGAIYWLDIGGGEPFLRNDLADIATVFNCRVIQIPTNGAMPDNVIEQLKRIKKKCGAQTGISISIDGLQETHDSVRGKPGSWDLAWDTFERVRSMGGVSLKINTVITNHNQDEIIKLAREVKIRDADFHSIILVRGNNRDPGYGLPSLEKLAEIGPELSSILGTYSYGQSAITAHILRNYHRYAWRLSMDILRKGIQVIPCLAGKSQWTIHANGDVSACEMLPPIGNVAQGPLKEIINSPAAKKQVRGIEDKECRCTHNCALFDSILFRAASIPSLLFHP